MPYTNPKQLLIDAAKFPAAIEAKLPAGAPVVSTMLIDTVGRLPELPDFLVEIPDLPAPPELPEFPAPPGNGARAGLNSKIFVTSAKVTPVQERIQVIPSPATGVLPEVKSRRGL